MLQANRESSDGEARTRVERHQDPNCYTYLAHKTQVVKKNQRHESMEEKCISVLRIVNNEFAKYIHDITHISKEFRFTMFGEDSAKEAVC